MDKIKIEHHIKHLQELHDGLDKEIQMQYNRHGDDRLVTELKKKKLKLKDEIEAFKSQII